MKVRQLIQILVFPKSFNVLSFYSKGTYFIRVHLTLHHKKDGTNIQAFPILIEGKQARKEQQKKAKVNTTENYYETEHFFVTFSQQKIVFHSACIFKVEYQVGQQYETCIDFELLYSSSKRKAQNQGVQPVKADRIVEKRRLYINCPSTLNRFKRVLFDDSDYFSFSDVLFISQSFGERPRLQEYHYSHFHNSNIRAREVHSHEAFQKWVHSTHQQKCHMLCETFNMSVEMFYSKMVLQKVFKYRKLCQTYHKYRFLMSTLNNSTVSEAPHIDQIEWVKVNKTKRQCDLMELYQTEQIQQIYLLIYQQSQEISRNAKYIWQLLTKLLITINFNLIDEQANIQIQDQRHTKNKWLLEYSDIVHDQIEEKRSQFIAKRRAILDKMDIFQDNDVHHPFLIIENFTKPSTTPKSRADIDSLVVMVHGYQGSSIDLEKARNFMNIYNPNCYGLLIKTIEDDIDNPIEMLGEAVAQQIRLHMINSLNNYKKINFIGYSLGGIIARQSIRHLERYKDMMNMFISFASPHAGIRDASNFLVKTGIWFLTNFQKNKNLKQLNCQQTSDSQIVTMAKLSDCGAISWFKRFVAVSSKEDCFVPYESSRLEQSSMGEMAKQICLNLKRNIRRLERVDVWFDVNHCTGPLDKMIGRKSHIQFLQNRLFLDCFFTAYGQLL